MHNEIRIANSLLFSAQTFLSGLWDQSSESYPEQFRWWPVHKHKKSDSSWPDLETRIRALSFTPFFVQKASCALRPKMIEAHRLLPIGREATSHKTIPCVLATPSNTGSAKQFSNTINLPIQHDLVSAAFGIGDLLTWFANAEHRRVVDGEASSSGFTVEPLPFFIAAGQYYSWILELRPPAKAYSLHVRIERRKLQILKKGLHRSELRLKSGEIKRELWLWQAFCGLLGYEIFWSRYLSCQSASTDSVDEELRSWFVGRIGMWAKVTGVTKWNDAHAALRSFTWPDIISHHELAETIWSKAMEESNQRLE
jgi:hypothetical protein